MQEPRPIGRLRLPAATLAAATVVLLVIDIVVGWSSPVADAAFLVMPHQMLIGDFARAGELLSWNPWVNGGSPDGVEPQFGARSPLVLGFAWLGGGTPLSFTLLFAFVWAFAAAGMARLARHLGAPAWAQLAVALAWASNGAVLGHASHPNVQHGIAFLPWALLGLDRALTARGRGWIVDAAIGGAALGLGALAGYPGVTVIAAMFLVAWAAWRVCGERVPSLRAATSLVVVFVVAGAALAPSHVGFLLEARDYTYREGALERDVATGWRTDDPVMANALEPRALASAFHPGLAPAAMGEPAGAVLRSTDPTSAGLHVGLGTWVLACVALVSGGRRRRWFALGAIGALFLGFALGGVLPLRAWLYDLLPPTRYFRHASLFRIPLLLVFAVLAAEGARRLAAGVATHAVFARIAASVAVVGASASLAAHASLGITLTSRVAAWWAVAHVGLVVIAWWTRRPGRHIAPVFAVWFMVEAIATFALGSPLVRAGPERAARLAADHVRSIVPGPDGFHRHLVAQTIDPALVEAFESGRIGPDSAGDPNVGLDAANVVAKRPVLMTRSAMGDPFHALIPWHAALRAQALGSDRVFFAADAVRAPRDHATFETYAEIAANRPVLLLHGPPFTPADADTTARVEAATLAPQPVTIVRHRATELVLSLVPPPDRDGWIYVTERFAPGWRAHVDGVAAPIERAGFVWRAVPVTAGAREVAFEYRPGSAVPLLWVSWGTLALVGLAAIVRAFRTPRQGADRR